MKVTKVATVLLISVIFGGAVTPVIANATTVKDGIAQNFNSERDFSQTGGIDPNNPVIEHDSQEDLTVDEAKIANDMSNSFVSGFNQDKNLFTDPSYADVIQSNTEKRGKAGVAIKVGVKAMKAGLKKIGAKAWDAQVAKYEKATGWDLVKINFRNITKILNRVSGFNGKIEAGIKKELKHLGFSNTIAAATAWFLVNALL